MKNNKISTMLVPALFACAAVLFSCGKSGGTDTPEPTPVPSAPTALAAVASSSTQIDLSWTDKANNETGFKVERSADGASGWTEIASLAANAVSYKNTDLTAGTTYYYRVRAYNTAGNSGYSNISGATTLNPSVSVPSAPTGLAAVALSSTQIDLSWTDKANNETGFKVERSANGTSGWTEIASLPANATAYQNTDLTVSTIYYYRVFAFNAGGNSAYSNTANAATLASVTPISAQPEANCYMVAPGSAAIYIPVSQANRVNTSDGLGAVTEGLGGVTADNYTVELVWGDTPVGATGVIKKLEAYSENGKGYVRVEPGVAGNAVVCIKDKTSGAVKWSWHIWVTGTVGFKKDTETGLTWMDRNLGAAGTTWNTSGKNGLYYQWGRKDAFPASDGTNNNQTYYTGTNTTGTTAVLPTGEYTVLPELVHNPLGFAINNTTYYGSLNVGNNNDSWGGVSGKKTLYDPCPAGWKVPPRSVNSINSWGSSTTVDSGEWTFINYIGTNKGALFNGVNGMSALGHFYPASGYRSSAASGAFVDVGSDGYYWSGTVNVTYSSYLHITSTSVSPLSRGSRVLGPPVRCVADVESGATIPATPTGLTAGAASSSQINLSWTDNANNETGYKVERSANGTSGWTEIASPAANAVSYQNTGLTAATAYYYRVRAYNTVGNSAYSNVANATTLASGTSPVLTTSAVTGITSNTATVGGNITNVGSPAYTERGVCYSSTTSEPTIYHSKWVITGTGTGNFSSTVHGLTPSTTYYMRAYATAGSNTAYGNLQTFKTLDTPAPVLTQPNPSTVTGNFDLTWTFPWPDLVATTDHYELEYSENGTTYVLLAKYNDNDRTSPFIDRITLDQGDVGKTLWFRVRVYTSSNYSPYSNVVSVFVASAGTIEANPTRVNIIKFQYSDASVANTSSSNPSTLTIGRRHYFQDFGGYTVADLWDNRCLMLFDINSQIAGKSIKKATLRLYASTLADVKTHSLQVASLAGNWNTSVTYNNAPSYYTSPDIYKQMPQTTATPWEIDITAIVKLWANGTRTNYGIIIFDPSTYIPYSTVDFSTVFSNSAYKPVLIIEFQ